MLQLCIFFIEANMEFARKHETCTRTYKVTHVRACEKPSDLPARQLKREMSHPRLIVNMKMDSGASLHIMSKNELISAGKDSSRRSKEATVPSQENPRQASGDRLHFPVSRHQETGRIRFHIGFNFSKKASLVNHPTHIMSCWKIV